MDRQFDAEAEWNALARHLRETGQMTSMPATGFGMPALPPARVPKPGLPILPVRATFALLDRVRGLFLRARSLLFGVAAGTCGLGRLSSRTFKQLVPLTVDRRQP